LIEILIQGPAGMSRAQLGAATRAPIEGLDEALLRLERAGIVAKDAMNDWYTLRLLPKSDTHK
jgi:DNA-binding IclR family transcriptional regulator